VRAETKTADTAKRNVAARAHKKETQEEAMDRRLRESAQVDERVEYVSNLDELKQQLRAAGNKLVVLEIMSDRVCETGMDEEAELHWKLDAEKERARKLEACSRIKHVFARTARECPDSVFLSVMVGEGEERTHPLLQVLGVERLPTIQFWRQGELLWEQSGSMGMEQGVGEGMLFYGNTAAGGEDATNYIKDLHSQAELDAWLASQPPGTLSVLDFATSCKPCMKVFPAVLALAKNFQGYVSFARILGDEGPEAETVMMDFNVIEVPTFVFFRDGKEANRHVGSSRGDLIGKILEMQAQAGIAPPPPPPAAKRKPAARSKRAPRKTAGV